MLILYTKDESKACKQIMDAFEERRLTYEERNIGDEVFQKELKDLGAADVPFMYDPQGNYKTGNTEDMLDYASEYSF